MSHGWRREREHAFSICRVSFHFWAMPAFISSSIGFFHYLDCLSLKRTNKHLYISINFFFTKRLFRWPLCSVVFRAFAHSVFLLLTTKGKICPSVNRSLSEQILLRQHIEKGWRIRAGASWVSWGFSSSLPAFLLVG